MRLSPTRRAELTETALAVFGESTEAGGRLRLELAFQDTTHAEWAIWQLAEDAEALAPPPLRAALRDRAAAILAGYDRSD